MGHVAILFFRFFVLILVFERERGGVLVLTLNSWGVKIKYSKILKSNVYIKLYKLRQIGSREKIAITLFSLLFLSNQKHPFSSSFPRTQPPSKFSSIHSHQMRITLYIYIMRG